MMNFFRKNLTNILLGAVALTLIFVTISLQVSFLSVQGGTTSERGLWATIRSQLAGFVGPEPTATAISTVLEGDTLSRNSDSTIADTAPANLNSAPPAETTTLASTESEATTPAVALAVAPEVSTTTLALSPMASTLYNAENVTVSEDDEILAAIVGAGSSTIGFFGYAYYLEHQDTLRTIAIRLPDGQLVGPNATSVANGLYPLARPLFLYTSPSILRERLDVERFIGCYLKLLPTAVDAVGYLPPSRTLFDQSLQGFGASCQECRRELVTNHPLADNVPVCDTDVASTAPILIVGSSTVKPLSDRMARLFTERGFRGTIEVDGSGTGAGFRNFCSAGRGDIVDASRPVTNDERTTCSAQGRALVRFPVAVDALAIVVSKDNTFLQEASLDELQQIFAYAIYWSDINPSWPREPISRAIPGAQSGTFDYFVEAVMEGSALDQLASLRSNPLTDANTTGSFVPSSPTSTPIGSGAFLNNSPNVRIGYVDNDRTCVANTELAALILERNYGLRVTQTPYPDIDSLFGALSSKDLNQRVDMTFCYIDPTDRAVRQRYFSYTEFIGSGYFADGTNRYVVVSNSNVKAPLERSNACLYQFLNRMKWNEAITDQVVWNEQDKTLWYEENLAVITNWTACD